MLQIRTDEPKVCLSLVSPIQQLRKEARSYLGQIKWNQFLYQSALGSRREIKPKGM